MMKSFQIVKSETIYQGKVFDVRQDRVRLPNGNLADLDIVEHSGAVTLLPVDNDRQMWFVRQYRHPAQAELIELPAGVMEEGETPEACAHREIREEIGMAATHLEKVGEFFLAPGYSTEYMYIFVATGLRPAPLQGDPDEFINIKKIPLEQVYKMARTGQFRDSKTLAGLFLAQPLWNLED
jgi:ADP-ribose pyrophosphatase